MPVKQPAPAANTFYPNLQAYLHRASFDLHTIPDERLANLAKVAEYIRARLSKDDTAKLTFICTHNSRRSHLSQIWAQVAAAYHGVAGVETFSGGTEATAFNPRAVAAMQRCGLRIEADDPAAENPHYAVYTSDAAIPMLCFSKVFDAAPNPTQGYGAIMTCSQADEACPVVMGCDARFPVRYEDPKVADDTEFEAQRYDERSAQICSEMLYLMSIV